MFFPRVITVLASNGSWTEVVLAYVPILFGILAMWLCLRARAGSEHKALVLTYTIVIAPFAFSYPVWLLFIWVMYRFGHYRGPMP